ncbi:hypothetical protein [Brevundimonas sp.]|uniref:hypothetical protein n=1 Tax=Brevundimonas sp. TaxID=1871086 RepID=UPI0035B21DC2
MLKTIIALAGATLISMTLAAPASAQDPNDKGSGFGAGQSGPAITAPTQRVTPSRTERSRERQARRQTPPPAPSPEEVLATAQQLATLANTGCQATEAKLLGVTPASTSLYEVACATGPGYIIETKTPPTAVDCVILAHSAQVAKAANAEADVGAQCSLPANADTDRVLRQYAQDAGVPCPVENVKVLGQSDGATIYEVGCTDIAGYWIRKSADGWTKTDCLQVVAEGGTCSMTTAAENAALLKSWLSGSPASDCQVTEARLMGRNDNGMFYEAKCAGADGVIARLNADRVVQQIYPCATAQRVGGGCTLTPAPAAAPAAATEQ